MTYFTTPQYIGNVKKGDTVMYGNKHYRVQDDGRGFLHIVTLDSGKRKKIPVDKADGLFTYGTEADYVFNRWWELYADYNQFRQFAAAETAWVM